MKNKKIYMYHFLNKQTAYQIGKLYKMFGYRVKYIY